MRQRLPNSRGQSTVEFALVLPIFVGSLFVLTTVVSLCLNVLALSDSARIAVRAAATAKNPAAELATYEDQCKCSLHIVTSDFNPIITIRAERTARISFINLPLPIVRLHAVASLMREPPLFFP